MFHITPRVKACNGFYSVSVENHSIILSPTNRICAEERCRFSYCSFNSSSIFIGCITTIHNVHEHDQVLILRPPTASQSIPQRKRSLHWKPFFLLLSAGKVPAAWQAMISSSPWQATSVAPKTKVRRASTVNLMAVWSTGPIHLYDLKTRWQTGAFVLECTVKQCIMKNNVDI